MWRVSALNLNRPADIRLPQGPGMLRRIASIRRRHFVVRGSTKSGAHPRISRFPATRHLQAQFRLQGLSGARWRANIPLTRCKALDTSGWNDSLLPGNGAHLAASKRSSDTCLPFLAAWKLGNHHVLGCRSLQYFIAAVDQREPSSDAVCGRGWSQLLIPADSVSGLLGCDDNRCQAFWSHLWANKIIGDGRYRSRLALPIWFARVPAVSSCAYG